MAEVVSVLRHELALGKLTAGTLDACINAVDRLWIDLSQSVSLLEKISTASELYSKVCLLLSHIAYERNDMSTASKWALSSLVLADGPGYNDELDENWPNTCFNLFENTPYSRAILSFTINEYIKASQKKSLALESKGELTSEQKEPSEQLGSDEFALYDLQKFVFDTAFARSFRNKSVHVCIALAIETRREDLISHILEASISGKFKERKSQILALLSHILSSLHLVWDGRFRNTLLGCVLDFYKRASTELTPTSENDLGSEEEEMIDENDQTGYLRISSEIAILMARNKEFKSLSLLVFEMMTVSDDDEFKQLVQLCLDISMNSTPSERYLICKGIKDLTDQMFSGEDSAGNEKVLILLKCFSTNYIMELGSFVTSSANFVDTELYLSIRDIVGKKFSTKTTTGTGIYAGINLSYSMMASGTKIDQFAITAGEYIKGATHWNRFAAALRLGSIFRYSTPTDAFITLESYLVNVGYKGKITDSSMSKSMSRAIENSLFDYENVTFDERANEPPCPYSSGGALMSLGLMFPGSAALSISALRDYKEPNFSFPASDVKNLFESMSVAEYLMKCLDVGIALNSQPLMFGASMGLALGIIGHMTPVSVIDGILGSSGEGINLAEKVMSEYKFITDKVMSILNSDLPDAGFAAGILMGVVLYNVNNSLSILCDKESNRGLEHDSDSFLLNTYREIVQTCENTEHMKIQQGISIGIAVSFMCFDVTNTNRQRFDLVKLSEALGKEFSTGNPSETEDEPETFDTFTSMISMLLNHRLSWMRACAVNCIGCAYAGTMNVKVVKLLLKITARDTAKEVSRAGVLSIGLVMCEDNSPTPSKSRGYGSTRDATKDANSDEFARIMQFLSTSHNSSIRAASALAMGIFGRNYNNSNTSERSQTQSKTSKISSLGLGLTSACHSKYNLETLMKLVFDSNDEVRQHALIGVSVFLQEAKCSFFPQNVFTDGPGDEGISKDSDDKSQAQKPKQFVKSPEQKRDEDAGMLVSPHAPIEILTGKLRRLMFDVATKNDSNLAPRALVRDEEKEGEPDKNNKNGKGDKKEEKGKETGKEEKKSDATDNKKDPKKKQEKKEETEEGNQNPGLRQKYHKYKTGENMLSRGAALFGLGLINAMGGNGVFQLRNSFGQINPVKAISCFIFEQFDSFHLLYELASVCCDPTTLVTVDDNLGVVPVEFTCSDPCGLFKYYAGYKAPPLIPRVRREIKPLKSIENKEVEDEISEDITDDNTKPKKILLTSVPTSFYIRKCSELAITSALTSDKDTKSKPVEEEIKEHKDLTLFSPFRVVGSYDNPAAIKITKEYEPVSKTHPMMGAVVVKKL